jgi:hypothetical protein
MYRYPWEDGVFRKKMINPRTPRLRSSDSRAFMPAPVLLGFYGVFSKGDPPLLPHPCPGFQRRSRPCNVLQAHTREMHSAAQAPRSRSLHGNTALPDVEILKALLLGTCDVTCISTGSISIPHPPPFSRDAVFQVQPGRCAETPSNGFHTPLYAVCEDTRATNRHRSRKPIRRVSRDLIINSRKIRFSKTMTMRSS